MAGYKVPQDVEAEDKFLGPLTFKQFLFMGGASILGYLMFLLYVNGAGLLDVILFPMFVFCLVMAFPWSKDQPTDLWLTARIRFLFMPRKRIWDQSGIKDLVEITTPKREAHVYTDGLSQNQVRDRLGALASVVDSRGWAVRGAPVVAPQTATPPQPDAIDRLDSEPLRQHFDTKIQESADRKRQDTLAMISSSLNENTPQQKKKQTEGRTKDNPQKDWYDNHNTQAIDPTLNSLRNSAAQPQIHHVKTTQKPLSAQVQVPNTKTPTKPANATSATPVDPGILSLSRNDDLNIETIARQAEKNDLDDEEVVISLHDN